MPAATSGELQHGQVGCKRRRDCCKVRLEALRMRRAVYLLLVVSLVQLSGLTTVCVRCHAETHPCCPMPRGTRLPKSPSLPQCCVAYLLNCQGSITEARDSHAPSGYTAQSAVQVRSVALFASVSRSVSKHVSSTASPPLSPLSQSCLLLI
jgi:hypothetical protein